MGYITVYRGSIDHYLRAAYRYIPHSAEAYEHVFRGAEHGRSDATTLQRLDTAIAYNRHK